MQWTNTTARKELSNLVFGALSKTEYIASTKDVFRRYNTTWKDQIALKVSAHYHGLGCNFLQSTIGLVLPFNFRGKTWTFDSWIEYRVEPMTKQDLPCKCAWFKEECLSVNKLTQSEVKKICPFFAIGNRRLDLCWIEKGLLDNIAITAEVETDHVIKPDLAKVHSIFVKSMQREQRGYKPIIHVQLELSGKDSSEEIFLFMKRHWADFALSPFIAYVTRENKSRKWKFYLLHRQRLLRTKTID